MTARWAAARHEALRRWRVLRILDHYMTLGPMEAIEMGPSVWDMYLEYLATQRTDGRRQ